MHGVWRYAGVSALALAGVVSTSFVADGRGVHASGDAPLGSCAPTLLAQDYTDPSRLFQIDTGTGTASSYANWTGAIDLSRADFDADGTLYAIRNVPGLRQPKWTAVDVERGVVTVVSPLPQDLSVIAFAFTASANASPRGYLLAGNPALNGAVQLHAIDSAWPLVLTPVATTFPAHNSSLGLGVSPDGSLLYYTTTDATYVASPPTFDWQATAFLRFLGLRPTTRVAGPAAGEPHLFIQNFSTLWTLDVAGSNASQTSLSGLPSGFATALLLRDCPAGGVRLVPQTGLTTTEAGGTAQFTAVLTTAPQAPVTVRFKTTNPAEGRIRTRALVFDPSNWFVPQTVTVFGVPDGMPDGTQAYWITGDPMVSSDPAYDRREVGRIPAVNIDYDARGPEAGVRPSVRGVR
jgi:hypothetical protein